MYVNVQLESLFKTSARSFRVDAIETSGRFHSIIHSIRPASQLVPLDMFVLSQVHAAAGESTKPTLLSSRQCHNDTSSELGHLAINILLPPSTLAHQLHHLLPPHPRKSNLLRGCRINEALKPPHLLLRFMEERSS